MGEFEDLRAEYEQVVIGELLYAKITGIIGRLLARRDPRIYAQGAYSSLDALGDVVNAFIIAELANPADPQIRYIMDVATTTDDVERLLYRLARRYLARTRARSVVSNLVERSRDRLRNPPFVASRSTSGVELFQVAGASYATQAASPQELRLAATLAAAVPTLRITATERLPKLYDASGLEAVLRILGDTVSGPFSVRDIQDFFDLLLTAWTTTFLEISEGDSHAEPLSAEDLAIANELASQCAATMTNDEALIYLYFRAGVSDRVLAERTGVSRQTVIARRRQLFTSLQQTLNGLDDEVQRATLERLSVTLAARGLEPS